MNDVAAFYRGEAVHPQGYTIDAVLGWDNERLAVTHDYIQWLFPLKKGSAQVPNSPILSAAEVELFRRDPGLRRTLLRSARRMLAFYGFALSVGVDCQARIASTPDFAGRRSDWLTPQNHNYRRISRILESLRLLGLAEVSRLFFTALTELYREDSSAIGWTVYSYWKEAAGG